MNIEQALEGVERLIKYAGFTETYYLGEEVYESLPSLEYLYEFAKTIRTVPTTHDSAAESREWDIVFQERKDSRDAVEKALLEGGERTQNGCFRWKGGHQKPGYGLIKVGYKWELVHRVAHEIWIGPIPEGLEIDHVKARGCEFRDCYEPAHLEAVTHQENILRAVRKTHCPAGHPYSGDNLYIRPRGHYKCRACNRIKEAQRKKDIQKVTNG